jgi:SPP1 family predicted phage head-tail adaptor
MTGNEVNAGGAIQDYYRYVLTLPYDTWINETMRVVIEGQTYNVISADASTSGSVVVPAKSWYATRRAIVERV